MKNVKKTIIIVVIVLAFGLIAFGIYNLTMSNKTKMLNILYDYFEESFDIKAQKENVKVNTNTSINITEGSDSKNYSLSGDIYNSVDKNQFYMNIIAKLDSVTLNSEIFSSENDIYFKLKEIKDIFYKKSLSNSSKIYTDDEYDECFDVLKDVINVTLKEKNFSKSKETIEVNNSKISTTKYTLTISYQNLYDFVENLYSKADKSVILKDYINDLNSNVKKDDVMSSIKTLIDGKESEKVFDYSIYVKGKNDIVKHLIEVPIKQESITTTLNIGFVSLENDNDLSEREFNVSLAGINVINASMIETQKGKYNITGSIATASLSFAGTYDETETVSSLGLSVTSSDDTKPIELSIITSKISDKETTFDLSLKTTLGLEIVSKNVITKDAEIPSVDVSSAVDYDSLTDAEKEVFSSLSALIK